MSVLGGLYSGISALSAQSRNFGIISDNIANVNTIGYKEVEGRFSNFVTSKSVARNFSPGGVTLRPFYDPQKQGLLQTSDSKTDISITGNGFFVVNKAASAANNSDSFLFTRAGDFTADKDGNLVNSGGYYLQGWLLNSDGTIVNSTSQDQLTSLQTVNVAGFSSVGQPTQNVSITANLPAGQDNAAVTPHQSTNLSIFDSLGARQTLTFQWDKTANANEWTMTAGITDSTGTFNAIAGATATVQFSGAGGLTGPLSTDAFTAVGAAFTLNADGTLDITIPQADLDVSGAELPDDLPLTLDLGTPGQADGLTQFSGGYELKLANQDGSAPSGLDQVIIDENGLVTGVFANGQTRAIYQIPTATFPAQARLDRDNGNAFSITSNSGDVVLNRPGVGAHGQLRPETLESSTADTAEEFADLIIAQRAYSAATRIVTTGDEMLDEAIRMKR
ncbi:flagellar hook protein FlgE [Oceanibaculum indicum]|uniref:Flagellar hook protein FlgE n=2 Tax=Oceanibaculum indicum TaxID=526216 RepID=K2JUP2_9PROT|nr:flagellar hook protein FlgE [Oceanibaculum indicum]EKE68955.1 flagellar hook protein FlgE [Oceanibaculum indicum P24]RKQ73795.1 flagellar hook protein FlgE [Oceanibaculum indicum]